MAPPSPHLTTAPSPASAPPPKRTPRACDECRRLKIRCEPLRNADEDDIPEESRRCRGCTSSGIGCTYTAPVHKRGPPKGYLSALEQRLNDAEALLGALICSKDPRATTLITDLSKDPLALSIISRVSNSEFGPTGRAERSKAGIRSKTTETPMFTIDSNGHLVFTTPSNTWQDYLDMRLSLEMKARTQAAVQSQQQNGRHPPQLNRTTTGTSATLVSENGDLSAATQAQGLKDIHMRLCGTPNNSISFPISTHVSLTFPTPPSLFPASPTPLSTIPKSKEKSNVTSSRQYTAEEINTWLTTDDMSINGTNTNIHHASVPPTNGSTTGSTTGTYETYGHEGDYGGGGGGGGGTKEHEVPYGALCDILGLDRKQWDL